MHGPVVTDILLAKLIIHESKKHFTSRDVSMDSYGLLSLGTFLFILKTYYDESSVRGKAHFHHVNLVREAYYTERALLLNCCHFFSFFFPLLTFYTSVTAKYIFFSCYFDNSSMCNREKYKA